MFILDASGSVGRKNWDRQMRFVQTILLNLDIGRNAVRAGVVVFSTKAKVSQL